MIIPLEPTLEGLAERRFFSFARQVLDRQVDGDQERITALVEAETGCAPEVRELKGQCDEYTACVRVLGDLARLRWKLVESGHGLELHSPRPQDARTSAPREVRRRKEAIRNELRRACSSSSRIGTSGSSSGGWSDPGRHPDISPSRH